MANVTQDVWEALHNEPILMKGLYLKLINHRALGRYLHEKHSIDAPLDTIISAIRRFDIHASFKDQFEAIPRLLKGSDISTKNNLVLVTLKNDINFYSELTNFLHQIKNINRQKFRQVSTDNSVKFIVDREDLHLVEKIFSSRILGIEPDLGEVRIEIPLSLRNTKGIAARISNEISSSDVNIKEIITCLPDFLIYVSEKDLAKAHESLMRLCS